MFSNVLASNANSQKEHGLKTNWLVPEVQHMFSKIPVKFFKTSFNLFILFYLQLRSSLLFFKCELKPGFMSTQDHFISNYSVSA